MCGDRVAGTARVDGGPNMVLTARREGEAVASGCYYLAKCLAVLSYCVGREVTADAQNEVLARHAGVVAPYDVTRDRRIVGPFDLLHARHRAPLVGVLLK